MSMGFPYIPARREYLTPILSLGPWGSLMTPAFSLRAGALGVFVAVALALGLGNFTEGKPCYREGNDGEKQ